MKFLRLKLKKLELISFNITRDGEQRLSQPRPHQVVEDASLGEFPATQQWLLETRDININVVITYMRLESLLTN
jgi:hypothetical protein